MTQSNEELHFYLRQIRPDEQTSLSVLASLVPVEGKVLDLGCGSGALGQYLSTERGCTCDGVTLSRAEAEHAHPNYRKVEVADLEAVNLPQLFAGHQYDAIVCADVLEHLRNPERILQACRTLLSPKGRLLISVPNAAYAGLTLDLMHGEFRYRAEGLLDKTHLRFFTRRSLYRFFQENGWSIDTLQAIRRELWDSEFEQTPDSLPPAVTRYLLSLPDALSYQFIGVVRPAASAEIAQRPSDEQAPHDKHATFTAQMYWGENGQYDEARKRVVSGRIGMPRQTLRFELPAHASSNPSLRLDPADRPGFLHLHSLHLRQADGTVCWQWRADESHALPLNDQAHHQISWAPPLATAPGTSLLLLTGNDPWFAPPIPTQVLAQCLQTPGCALEMEIGWPMSADYLALAHRTHELQTQSAHAEHALAQLQHAHRQASLELAQLAHLVPLSNEHAQLQQLHHQLNLQMEQVQAHVRGLENSRVFRLTRPIARLKHKATRLLKGNTEPAPQPIQLPEVTPDPSPSIPTPAPETPSPDTPAAAPSTPPTIAPPAAIVDIIIPVYRGMADTQRCLGSVLHSTLRTPARIIVINDASPDTELTQWLRDQAQCEPRITLLENSTNLGFVQTVNRGMALAPDHDVLLLNSDTEVAGNWLDRLREAVYRQPDIGTATPLSNNATICSYPRFCEKNALPPGHDTASMDALCAATHASIGVDIPTAVGFCMYIRRDCLAQTGPFDAQRFGAGYGEENDFCIRATRHGWRHVLAMDTYVRHVGGVSFGASKSPREAAAQAILHQLHPTYEATIQAHVAADPARPYREALDVARLKNSTLPRILAVLHGIGGGTRRHVHELSTHFEGRAICLTLTPLADHRVRLEWDDAKESFALDYHGLQQADELVELLRQIGIDQIHYHHLLGVNPDLMRLPEQLGVTYDFTAHDYYNACPQIALVDPAQSYCGEQGIEQCINCLQGRPAPTGETIQDWRLRHRIFLNGARTVLAPSRDAAQRLEGYFPTANVRHAPHLDITPRTPLPSPAPRSLHPSSNLRVFVVGAINQIKGANTLEAAAQEAARIQAPIEFHLLGYAHRPLQLQPHASLSVHGAYDDADLPHLLRRLQPDLIWFPARWPETYSYTLSACLQSGAPVIATNLGAFPERLAGRAWSWIRPWDTAPGDWLSFMLELRQQHYVQGIPPTPAPGMHIQTADDHLPAWSYDTDYLTNAPSAPVQP